MPCYFSQSDAQLGPQESGGRRQLEVEDGRDGLVRRGVDGPRARRPCRLRLWGGRRRGRRGHLYQGRGVLRRLRAAMALTWSWVCSGPRGRYDPLLLVLAVVVIRMMLLYHYRQPLAAQRGHRRPRYPGDPRSRIACYILVMPARLLLSFQARLHDSPAERLPRKAQTPSRCWRGS